ncbi:MAG: anti-sigma F factor [Lachnospiraceae bacterium]|nr:anti-sigma F factor [Lachnospiraceae bacterium]
MDFDNKMYLCIDSRSENEAFARIAVAAFISGLDPLISELADVKTAVSEAVTNSVIHGYEDKIGEIKVFCGIKERTVYIEVSDNGSGIENIEQAREPMFTTKPHLERSGMGFTVMETFMDRVDVISEVEVGTTIKMEKILKPKQ